jgi:glucose dehydrogenase
MLKSKKLTISLLALSVISLAACAGVSNKHLTDSKEWPSFGRDYTNQRMSPLTQINTRNAENLGLAWQFKTGVATSVQGAPIVTDGVMYVALPYNHVAALDAKTGKELWRYQHERKANWKMCCGPANRGVAVSGGKVFIGTVDARLIALDAKTGAKIWDINVADDTAQTENTSSLSKSDAKSKKDTYGGTGIGIAMAPVVYNGKVIVGVTGVGYGLHVDTPRIDAPLGAVIGLSGLYGRPGFLAAFDVNSGNRVWQFDTIPSQGWEGVFAAETSDGISLNRDVAAEKENAKNHPDAWRYGGGSAWSTPAIDTKTNTLFFGTGNPSPQMNDISRPGDNLYTVSLVALNTETGKIKWHYQQVPHDVWGYDLASPPVLFDYVKDGKKIPAVGQAGKTGWYYVNDRATGALLMKSEAFVPQKNLFAKATKQGTVLYPGILGGANWSPTALDQSSQTAYVAGIHAPIKYTLVEEIAKDESHQSPKDIKSAFIPPRTGLPSYAAGQLIVKVKRGVTDNQMNRLGIRQAVIKTLGTNDTQLWQLKQGISVEQALEKAKQSGLFEYAEPNQIIRLDPRESKGFGDINKKQPLEPIRYTSSEPTKDPRWGTVSAINLTTGKIQWQVKTEQPLMGGILATRGGLLFMGEGDGRFNVYNISTGDLLWQDKVDAGVNAPPISYEIDGVQYVAVVAGGNAIFGFTAGDNILVYTLKK